MLSGNEREVLQLLTVGFVIFKYPSHVTHMPPVPHTSPLIFVRLYCRDKWLFSLFPVVHHSARRGQVHGTYQ